MANKASEIKLGAILNYAVIGLNTLVTLFYTPYMLRMMGQSEYGLYSLVASVIGYLALLDLGFGNAIIRYTAKYRAEGKVNEQYELFGMFFVLYLIIGILSLIGGSALYFNVDNMFGSTMTPVELEKARIMMLILVFNIAFSFPMSLFGCIMTAYERFTFPRIVRLVRITLNTVVMVVLLHYGYKAIAMVVTQTIFNVITLFINLFYCKFNLKIKIKYGKPQWGLVKEIAIYSLWIVMELIMDKFNMSSGQFVLGIVSGTVAVSIFSIGIHLQSTYAQFSTAISSIFLPKVTGMTTLNKNNQEIADLFVRIGRIQNIIAITIISGFVVFGKQFLILWAGSDYHQSYLITLVLFIGMYIPIIQSLGYTILQARNEMKFRAISCTVVALLFLVFQFVFSEMWGALGCAIAISLSLIVGQGLIMNIHYYKKQHIDIVSFWKEITKMNILPIIITILSFFFVRLLHIETWVILIVAMVIFIVVYLLFFYVCSLNRYEKSLILEIFSRKTK